MSGDEQWPGPAPGLLRGESFSWAESLSWAGLPGLGVWARVDPQQGRGEDGKHPEDDAIILEHPELPERPEHEQTRPLRGCGGRPPRLQHERDLGGGSE